MNREQRKYTLERIERIAQEKRAEKTRWSEDDRMQVCH